MRYREIDEPVTGEEIAALAARIQAEIAYDRDRAPRRWPPMWWCEWVVSPWLSWRGRRPDAVCGGSSGVPATTLAWWCCGWQSTRRAAPSSRERAAELAPSVPECPAAFG
jgi:hypothetical protein